MKHRASAGTGGNAGSGGTGCAVSGKSITITDAVFIAGTPGGGVQEMTILAWMRALGQCHSVSRAACPASMARAGGARALDKAYRRR